MITKEEIQNFEREIEKISSTFKMSPLEAIVQYCTITGLEPASCSKLISKSLKAKLSMEANRLNLLKKTGRSLPK